MKTDMKETYTEYLKSIWNDKAAEQIMNLPHPTFQALKELKRWEITYRLLKGYKTITDKYGYIVDFPSEGHEIYDSEWWAEKSQRVKERDNFTCQRCRETDTILHAHHIKKWRKFDFTEQGEEGEAHKMSNLVTVCPPCHFKIENKNKEEQYKEIGWL